MPFPSFDDPAIRRLAGDEEAEPLASARVRQLLNFPPVHPYKKWWGTHWRLVELADLRLPPQKELERGVDQELRWLVSPRRKVKVVNGLARRCASQEGNAVYAISVLGYAGDRRVRRLVDWLLEWQWPDGGWNCDVNASGRRSSFHETVTPALGLLAYHHATSDTDARAAAIRATELFLEHRLFRSLQTGEVIHASWLKPHYPPYWHYDLLQGLWLLRAAGRLDDPRAREALSVLRRAKRADGQFPGGTWTSERLRPAVTWEEPTGNEMLTFRAQTILDAAAAFPAW